MKRQKSLGSSGLVPAGAVVTVTNILLGDISKTLEHRGMPVDAQASNSKKRTQIRAATRRRSKERSRRSPPVGVTFSHKSDQNMSVKTQELVKAWIKESSLNKEQAGQCSKNKGK